MLDVIPYKLSALFYETGSVNGSELSRQARWLASEPWGSLPSQFWNYRWEPHTLPYMGH